MTTVTVDFVARGSNSEPWQLVLIEQGPWRPDEIDLRLRNLQARLYGCIDAVLDGELANTFPESKGAKVSIRVDGYDLPDEAVCSFFQRFSEEALKQSAYANTPNGPGFEAELSFELNLVSADSRPPPSERSNAA